MGVITYNGISSSSLGLNVEICPNYPVPTRVTENISVIGRNGDLLFDTGAYTNVERAYDLYVNAKSTNFQTAASKIANWLVAPKGYNRLEDDYEPDVYMMATVSNQSELRNWMNYMGRMNVRFNCKPQRFLKTGEAEIDILNQGTPSAYEYNNLYMATKPLFILTGNGEICQFYSEAGEPIQGFKVTNNASKTINVDSETMNAWSGIKSGLDSGVVNMSVTYQQTPPIYFSFDAGTELFVKVTSERGTDELNFAYTATGDTTTAYQTLTNSTSGNYKLAFNRDSYGTSLIWNGPTGSIYDVIDLTVSFANYQNRNSDISRVTTDYAVEETFPVLGHGHGLISRDGFTAAKMIPRWWRL